MLSSSFHTPTAVDSLARQSLAFMADKRGPAFLTLSLLAANTLLKPALILAQPNEKKTLRNTTAVQVFATNLLAFCVSLPVVMLLKGPANGLLAKATITNEAKEVLNNLLLTAALATTNLALPLLTSKATLALAQWRKSHLSIQKISAQRSSIMPLARPYEELANPSKGGVANAQASVVAPFATGRPTSALLTAASPQASEAPPASLSLPPSQPSPFLATLATPHPSNVTSFAGQRGLSC